ncbi:YdcF family protein [Entomobacter blattae]|uniref:DUF218 domain-containing protein n=1 Tax=Entomobacter blattae TaxID=2762277 RepID=A0A7H1NPB8_9PROT|nr:YdcF family protein [Entomobacter blattae]QNT77628.1 hypothetical protein JGUZn3_03770 [Entomobacter blattae]
MPEILQNQSLIEKGPIEEGAIEKGSIKGKSLSSPWGYEAVIIIFGAAHRPNGQVRNVMRHRVERAVSYASFLRAQGYRRILYIPTGGVTGKKYHQTHSEAQSMQCLLVENHVKPEDIFCENHALDTLDSVKICSALLARLLPSESISFENHFFDRILRHRLYHHLYHRSGHRSGKKTGYRVVLVSSAYHIIRCWVLMRLLGWKCVGVWPNVPAAPRKLRRWYWRLREIPALLYDCTMLVLGRVWQKIRQEPF